MFHLGFSHVPARQGFFHIEAILDFYVFMVVVKKLKEEDWLEVNPFFIFLLFSYVPFLWFHVGYFWRAGEIIYTSG